MGNFRPKGRVDWGFVGMLALAGVVAMTVWASPLVYPIRLFVTLMHELSHAVAAIATGGQVDSIALFPGAGGLAWTRGGNPRISLSPSPSRPGSTPLKARPSS